MQEKLRIMIQKLNRFADRYEIMMVENRRLRQDREIVLQKLEENNAQFAAINERIESLQTIFLEKLSAIPMQPAGNGINGQDPVPADANTVPGGTVKTVDTGHAVEIAGAARVAAGAAGIAAAVAQDPSPQITAVTEAPAMPAIPLTPQERNEKIKDMLKRYTKI